MFYNISAYKAPRSSPKNTLNFTFKQSSTSLAEHLFVCSSGFSMEKGKNCEPTQIISQNDSEVIIKYFYLPYRRHRHNNKKRGKDEKEGDDIMLLVYLCTCTLQKTLQNLFSVGINRPKKATISSFSI